jgi:hypothetical protein
VTSFFPSTRGMFVPLFAVSVRKCTFNCLRLRPQQNAATNSVVRLP